MSSQVGKNIIRTQKTRSGGANGLLNPYPARALPGLVKERVDLARGGRGGEPVADYVGEVGVPAASTHVCELPALVRPPMEDGGTQHRRACRHHHAVGRGLGRGASGRGPSGGPRGRGSPRPPLCPKKGSGAASRCRASTKLGAQK